MDLHDLIWNLSKIYCWMEKQFAKQIKYGYLYCIIYSQQKKKIWKHSPNCEQWLLSEECGIMKGCHILCTFVMFEIFIRNIIWKSGKKIKNWKPHKPKKKGSVWGAGGGPDATKLIICWQLRQVYRDSLYSLLLHVLEYSIIKRKKGK